MRARLLLLLATLAVVAIAGEALLRSRADGERKRIHSRLDARELCTAPSPDPRLIYTYKPGECGANSRGFRDREHALQKPANTFRILLIGDSVAEGRDVDPDSSFGRVLERSLAARGDSLRYEVILLARIGYSTSQELVLLEDEAPRYDPDLVLWSYCLNDPAHPVHHNANGDLGRYYDRPRSYLLAMVQDAAFRAKQKLRGRGCPREFHAFVHCAFWPEVEENLARIGKLSKREHVPVAFVIHPIFENAPSFQDYTLKDVHARLAVAARRSGLDVIDVLEAFSPYAAADLKIQREDYFDPWHMNERGHRVTATFIERKLAAHIP